MKTLMTILLTTMSFQALADLDNTPWSEILAEDSGYVLDFVPQIQFSSGLQADVTDVCQSNGVLYGATVQTCAVYSKQFEGGACLQNTSEVSRMAIVTSEEGCTKYKNHSDDAGVDCKDDSYKTNVTKTQQTKFQIEVYKDATVHLGRDNYGPGASLGKKEWVIPSCN